MPFGIILGKWYYARVTIDSSNFRGDGKLLIIYCTKSQYEKITNISVVVPEIKILENPNKISIYYNSTNYVYNNT